MDHWSDSPIIYSFTNPIGMRESSKKESGWIFWPIATSIYSFTWQWWTTGRGRWIRRRRLLGLFHWPKINLTANRVSRTGSGSDGWPLQMSTANALLSYQYYAIVLMTIGDAISVSLHLILLYHRKCKNIVHHQHKFVLWPSKKGWNGGVPWSRRRNGRIAGRVEKKK